MAQQPTLQREAWTWESAARNSTFKVQTLILLPCLHGCICGYAAELDIRLRRRLQPRSNKMIKNKVGKTRLPSLPVDAWYGSAPFHQLSCYPDLGHPKPYNSTTKRKSWIIDRCQQYYQSFVRLAPPLLSESLTCVLFTHELIGSTSCLIRRLFPPPAQFVIHLKLRKFPAENRNVGRNAGKPLCRLVWFHILSFDSTNFAWLSPSPSTLGQTESDMGVLFVECVDYNRISILLRRLR